MSHNCHNIGSDRDITKLSRMHHSRHIRHATIAGMQIDLLNIDSEGTHVMDAGTYQTGLFGEDVVARRLEGEGWKIIGQRIRTRWGELDIIARRADTIAFIEVKTAGPGRIGVDEAVDARSRHRIRRAAVAWMATSSAAQRAVRRYRFDVCFVHRCDDGSVDRIDHVRNAF